MSSANSGVTISTVTVRRTTACTGSRSIWYALMPAPAKICQLLPGIFNIPVIHDVVPLENRTRLVPGDLHRHLLRYPRPDQPLPSALHKANTQQDDHVFEMSPAKQCRPFSGYRYTLPKPIPLATEPQMSFPCVRR